jgi:hypothetical protein
LGKPLKAVETVPTIQVSTPRSATSKAALTVPERSPGGVDLGLEAAPMSTT